MAAAAALAAATPATHAANLAGLPFRLYAPLAAVLASGAAAWVLLRVPGGTGTRLRRDWRGPVALASMCGLAALLLLRVQHATSDDSAYLPPVVRCLADPGSPPGWGGFLWIGESPPPLPRWALPVPFDFLEGVLAWATGIPLLTVRYLVVPPLLAALVPLAWFLLLHRAGFGERPALAGTFAGLAALLLMREGPAAPGCVLLLRVYQAKFFFLAVLLPLFAARALDFLRAPSPRGWGVLAVLATASAGCSLSSVLLQVLLAPALAAAGAVAAPARWRRAVLLLAAVLYPAAVALWIHGDARADLAPTSAVNLDRERTLEAHATAVFGGPLTAGLSAAGLLAAALALAGEVRRFLLGWSAAILVLYLNPVVAGFVMENVTSTDIYWRTCYLLPLPLWLAVPGALLAARREAAGARRSALPAVLAAAGLLLAQLPARSAGLFRATQFAYPWPTPDNCLGPAAADARWIAATAPPGPFLAPQYVSTLVPMIAADLPAVVHWPGPLRLWMDVAGRADEARLRLSAGQALQSGEERGLAALAELLRRHPAVRSVAARPEALRSPGLEAALSAGGFLPAGASRSGLRLFVRPGR